MNEKFITLEYEVLAIDCGCTQITEGPTQQLITRAEIHTSSPRKLVGYLLAKLLLVPSANEEQVGRRVSGSISCGEKKEWRLHFLLSWKERLLRLMDRKSGFAGEDV